MSIMSFLKNEESNINDKCTSINKEIASLESGELRKFHSSSIKARWIVIALVTLVLHPLVATGVLSAGVLIPSVTLLVTGIGCASFFSDLVIDRYERKKSSTNRSICKEEYEAILKRDRNQNMIELIRKVSEEKDLEISNNYLNKHELQEKLMKQENAIEDLISKFKLLSNVVAMQRIKNTKYTKNLKLGILTSLALSSIVNIYCFMTGHLNIYQFINYFFMSASIGMIPDLIITIKDLRDKETVINEIQDNLKCKYNENHDYSMQLDYVKDKLANLCISYEKDSLSYKYLIKNGKNREDKQEEYKDDYQEEMELTEDLEENNYKSKKI